MKTYQYLQEKKKNRYYIQDLKDKEIITEDEYNVFNNREIEKIAKIYDNDIYDMYILGNEQNSIYKEQNFYTLIDYDVVSESKGLKESLENNNIVITENDSTIMQGVIDLYIIIGNEIYLIDYKTDNVYEKDELIKRYEMQLKLYEYSFKKHYGNDYNIHKYIYSTNLGSFIPLND